MTRYPGCCGNQRGTNHCPSYKPDATRLAVNHKFSKRLPWEEAYRELFTPFQNQVEHEVNSLHPHPDVLHHRGYSFGEELGRGRLVGIGVHLHFLDLGQLHALENWG